MSLLKVVALKEFRINTGLLQDADISAVAIITIINAKDKTALLFLLLSIPLTSHVQVV
jgi:hypothetical protein